MSAGIPWAAGIVVAVLATGCRLGFDEATQVVFVDDDQATFDLGSYDGGAPLGWRDGQVALVAAPFDPTAVGIYVSRPFDAGNDAAAWTTLSWIPIAPQGRPLPDQGGADVGYAEGGVDMAANHLLLHLDDASPTTVRDSSGQGHDGRLVFAGGGISPVVGAFNGGLDADRDAWVSLDGDYFDFGTDDFTYAVWVKMYPCADSNDNRIAMGGEDASGAPHMWIGALCPDACPNGDGAFMNFLDSTYNGPSLAPCTGVVLDDGAWHHLVGVKRGHTAPAAIVHLYVDGREVDAGSFDFGTSTFTYDGGEVRLGGFNLGGTQYNTRIIVDEAAMWTRALADAEVVSLHRRGAARLALQLRICGDGVCDDEPFVGPDGTTASYFTEEQLVGAAGGQRGNLDGLRLVGRVAQYRARFTTSSTTISPGLVRVALAANLPAR